MFLHSARCFGVNHELRRLRLALEASFATGRSEEQRRAYHREVERLRRQRDQAFADEEARTVVDERKTA